MSKEKKYDLEDRLVNFTVFIFADVKNLETAKRNG